MIGKLKGTVDSIHADHIILDVNGVGYLVYCSGKTMGNLVSGQELALLIETHVREDHINLYGFYNHEEKTSFSILQSVKGVGTKMAMSILSALSPEEIAYALSMKDAAIFKQISGVGKKLAERIVTELKDLYSSKQFTNAPIVDLAKNSSSSTEASIIQDAVLALASLGVPKLEAQNRVMNLFNQNKDISLSELIKLALRNG